MLQGFLKHIRGNILLFGIALAISLHADQVVLKNGRTLDCTIIAEYSDYVEISLGTGSMSIPRSKLVRLVRTAPSTQTTPKSDSQTGNILSAQHAPVAHAELATEFRKLMSHRNLALDAQYMMAIYDRDLEKRKKHAQELDEEILQLEEALAEISWQTAEIKLPDQAPRGNSAIRAYNELISKKQKLQDKGSAIHAQIAPLEREKFETLKIIPDLKAKYKLTMQPIPVYHKELHSFSASYFEYRQELDLDIEDAGTKALFAKVDRYLDKFKKEISATSIKSKQVGNSTIVRVLVNRATVGEFIFDTGATTMTISESFAAKLGIPIGSLPITEMVVADGSIVEVKAAMLSSVSLGSSEVKDVAVLVVADSPNSPEDGLLGMSYLKYFSIGLNGVTGEIELTRFDPDR